MKSVVVVKSHAENCAESYHSLVGTDNESP